MASLPLPFSAAWRKGKDVLQQDVASPVSQRLLSPSLSASLPSPCEDAGMDREPAEVPGDGTICGEADELDSAHQWQAAQTTPCLLS